MAPSNTIRLGYWLTKKKSQKIDWSQFEHAAKHYKIEAFPINSEFKIEGPIHVFLHKLTDIIALAENGDSNANDLIHKIETFLSANRVVTVIDPIPSVKELLNRFKCYNRIKQSGLEKYGVFTPNFCEIRSHDPAQIAQELNAANVTYPFICKPPLGHGSKKAHEMMIIFNEESLADCSVPCVAQSFINHNAVLFKLYIVGEKHCYVERPSLKNFYAGNLEPIQFETGDVCKAGSQSVLNMLEPDDLNEDVCIDKDVFNHIASTVRAIFNMDLLGVDVVIEKNTKQYYIIDVNSFPGYDGFPNFYDNLFKCISEKVHNRLEFRSTCEKCNGNEFYKIENCHSYISK